ncbi:hypothetical protein NPIL_362121 [Nephila pilipes]|uniref:Uncharacterized protein n=1 Tax=Nephila pilipes TaxID=299642 RepID=A0A8X6T9A8_NEPPI|nr:hypothetical protein NPIL_362121 [Nephila pilipes]
MRVLHLAERCNPWDQYPVVPLTIPQAYHGIFYGCSIIELFDKFHAKSNSFKKLLTLFWINIMPGITMKISSAKLLDDETFNLLMTRIKETLHIVPYMEDVSKIPIFTDILPEIAGLIYLSSENENLLEQSNKCVTEICSLVFNVKTKPYDAFLTNDTSTNETEKLITPNWAVKEFIQRMHSLVQNQDYIFGSISSSIACASLMKRIMLHIFEGKRSDLEPLKILGLFCAMSGLDIPLLITTSSCCNNMFKDNEKSSLNIL